MHISQTVVLFAWGKSAILSMAIKMYAAARITSVVSGNCSTES